MSTPQALYNSLPSLGEAYTGFVDREILRKLVPVFKDYKEFAVCLVHRHCSLDEGELMVTTGDVTEPKRDVVQAFPHSWLVSSEPFEYSSEPTPALPLTLLENFKQVVGDVNVVEGTNVLGISYIPGGAHWGELFIERTEGRRNIVRKIIVDGNWRPSDTIPTCWLPALTPPGEMPLSKCECEVQNGVHIEVNCTTKDGSLLCQVVEKGMEWYRGVNV